MASLKKLTVEQLKNLNEARLKNVLKSVQAVASSIQTYNGPRCCEECHEYIGDDWERDVLRYLRPVVAYKERVLSVLAKKFPRQRPKA